MIGTLKLNPRRPVVSTKLLDDMRKLDQSIAATANRNERAIALITELLGRGVTTAKGIIDVLWRLGFDNRHVAIMLSKNAGSNAAAYHWKRLATGDYQLHA